MTQNEKDILQRDLCARVPYGVKFKHEGRRTIGKILSIVPKRTYTSVVYFDDAINHPKECDMDDIKPYLFPLSSMGEDQKYEFYLRFIVKDCDCVFDYFKFCLDNGKWHKLLTSLLAVEEIIDWFHKNHIDYRGLIPMGLTNDATDKNIY